MSIDAITPETADDWQRDIDLDIALHRRAVAIAMAGGLDDPETAGLPPAGQHAVVAELGQILGLFPTPTADLDEEAEFAPGMVLESTKTGSVGRRVRLLVKPPGAVVWVVAIVRHPTCPARVGKHSTMAEQTFRRKWRVVSRPTPEVAP